jgi:predicted nucleotidyltransferase
MTAGFPLPQESVIHLFVGGSALHGAKVEGYDDLDIYGCYIDAPERRCGIMTMEHFCWSTGSQAEKNGADDVDVTMYSLHRWAELVMKSNPAVMHYLFAPYDPGTVWARHIAPLGPTLLTKKAAKQYLGYANSQRMRLTGERGMGRHGQRPDLIEKYGWDCKFGMHMIRVMYECRELLTDRFITLPRPEKDVLIDLRTGKYTQDDAFRLYAELRAECDTLLDNSSLPDVPCIKTLSRAVARAYKEHWEATGL